MTTDTTLLPCAFCGGTRAYTTDNDAATAIHVNCRDCGAQLYGHRRHFGSVEEAIAAWNRRPSPSVHRQASAGQEGVKPLDDPRLQQLFGDAIEGALAFGFQGNNPPPEGHWLWRFWNIGRAEATKASTRSRARQWRPIETAPKDGTRVILEWDGKSINGFYLDNSQSSHPWQGWRVESLVVKPSGNPTRWQPFPTAGETL